jgi:hypothetical protein
MPLFGNNILKQRQFTYPWPAMYMYFYTTQQNRCLRVNASRNYAKLKNDIFIFFFLTIFNKNMFLNTT